MLASVELLTAALVLTGPFGTVGPAADAGLSAVQPHVATHASAPAAMGLARLRSVRLTVSGDPGHRVLLGLSTANQPTALAPLPGLALGPEGLIWLADGRHDPTAVVGADGFFRTELVVPDGLPLDLRLVAQAITFDPATGRHDVSPALDLRVEDVLEYRFDGDDAGWRALGGDVQSTARGLAVTGPALLVRPVQGLEPGADYRIDMTVGLAFEASAEQDLRAGATPAAPRGPGAAAARLTFAGASARSASTATAARADRRGRLWLVLEAGEGALVLERAVVRISR